MWKNSREAEKSFHFPPLPETCTFAESLHEVNLLHLALMVSSEAVKTGVLHQEIMHLNVSRLQKLPEYLI